MLALRHAAPALLLVATSCGPSRAEADYRSPSATSKFDAIMQSASRGDDADLTRLVEQLESDDPAVRMTAEATLRRLTGESFGYRHFDSADERSAAIRRWTESIEAPAGGTGVEGEGEDEGAHQDG